MIIADDEPNAREYLVQLINEMPSLKLMGAYKNGAEVIQFCKTMVPDIILLDIEMPGINGIDTARKLMQMNPNCLILFITAYDHYAIAAFELMAIGYLLKPFSTNEFEKVINRAEQMLQDRDKLQFQERIERLWKHYHSPKKTFLKTIEIKEKGLIVTVQVSDILFIKSDSEYVQITTHKGTYLQRQSLTLLLDQLPDHFHRIHRSYILNSDKIQSWRYLVNGTFQFQLAQDFSIRSSRSYQNSINDWLRNKRA